MDLREFHERGTFSKNIVLSFIALIPKKAIVDSAKDLRPISLLGSINKILAKILAGRLKKVMPSIISHSQAAFINGRQILDGVIIANECIHSRHKDKEIGILCELDLEKAYDRVD